MTVQSLASAKMSLVGGSLVFLQVGGKPILEDRIVLPSVLMELVKLILIVVMWSRSQVSKNA